MTELDMTPVPDRVPWLRKAVEWVEWNAELPEIDREWDQDYYYLGPHHRAAVLLRAARPQDEYAASSLVAAHCGSAYCVAGYLGRELDPAFTDAEVVDLPGGGEVHVADFVAAKLGLVDIQGVQLFNGNNTAADVRRIAEQIAGQTL